MKETTRVNLHCHSVFSDGELSPETLAEKLAAAGVQFASLTDHDSIDGLPRFHDALKRHNIGFLSGVEITAHLDDREIHLLAYGFDINHPELEATLPALRQARAARAQGPLRKMPPLQARVYAGEPVASVAATGKIGIREAIALVHRAGGRAFLAHPFVFETDHAALDLLFADLKAMGLDGIEAICDSFGEAEQQPLTGLAQKQGLLISAGTDFHASKAKLQGLTDGQAQKHGLLINAGPEVCVDMPTGSWKLFIRSICSSPTSRTAVNLQKPIAKALHDEDETSRTWSFMRLRIILPALLVIALFVAAMWGLLLPFFEDILIDRKRELILELTNSAMSILVASERDERAGLLTRGQAQETAKSRIGALRYGKEGKDYFWIQDMQPRILMHPYRPDLNGQDVSDFIDPRGAHIFVEFAQLVRRQQQGYVEYVWQWKDDPERLAAKESYVSGFAPWGWIIGTGMYTDDVKQEIARIEQSLVNTLIGISAVVFFFLLYTVRQSLHIERRRAYIQESLRESKERYRSLIEATTEGTLLILDGRCRYGNPIMGRMTGYRVEQLELLDLSDLLPRDEHNETAWARIERLSNESTGSESFEAALERSDGNKVECIITLNPISLDGRSGIILLAKEVSPSSVLTAAVSLETEQEALIRKLQGSLLFLHEPIGHMGAQAVACSQDTPIHKAASLMIERNTTGIVVEADAGVAVGFVTDHDVRERAARNNQADLQAPVRTIMSSPLITISEHALICEALMRMEEKKVQHLVVEDENGRRVRMVRAKELLRFHRYGPAVPTHEIAQAKTIDEVARSCARVPALVKALLDVGARPRNVTHMISSVCDAATERFIHLAIEELGSPPVPFAFIALGSQGRQEQTLLTDQDNAIIFQPQEDPAAEAGASAYFLSLGARVCEWLDQAGYPLCRGKSMANNPAWCRSLPEWKEYFRSWILKAEPRELMEFSLFFDFRTVYGVPEFAHELRSSIHGILDGQPNFFPFFAQNALLFKPPFRPLGRIIKRGGPPEEAGLLNLKETLMPLVGFGRLYALRYNINHTHTMKRIEALVGKNVLAQPTGDALAASYDFLMRLRFRTQLSKIEAGRKPDNNITPDRLAPWEEAMLKQAFLQIESAQKKIVYDFLGGAEWPGG